MINTPDISVAVERQLPDFVPDAQFTSSVTDTSEVLRKDTLTAKGDLITATGASLPQRLGAGTDGQVLTADSVSSVGLSWKTLSKSLKITAQFDKTNTTLANITGLTSSLLASTAYRFRACLYVDTDAVGGHKYAVVSSGTVTAIIYQIISVRNSTGLNVITSRQTSSGGSAGEASGTQYFTTIEGLITTNAAGTLGVQFAQNAAGGTSSVLVGSTLTVELLT